MKVNKKYLLGLDTGSSKTHALISDLLGNVKGFADAGCGNYEMVGVKNFTRILNHVTDKAIAAAEINKDEIAAMGFGFAGFDWPSEADMMNKAINSLGIQSPYQFVNDVTIGLIAGSSEGWGVAADAGTGNNVRGRDKFGKIGRITGNGMRFGEFGGASELVWSSMVFTTYAWSKRESKTQLTNLLIDFAKVKGEDELIEGLAMGKIHLSSELAIEILQLAREGDLGAKQVVEFNAVELAKNVNAVVRQLDFQDIAFEVIMIGSVFKAGEIYTKPFQDTILKFAPEASFIRLSVPPVVGSVLLAGETIGVRSDKFRKNLIRSSQERLHH